MPGRLTTHVLDTASGKPAAGLELSLWSISDTGERAQVTMVTTNADGRTDAPLLEGDDLKSGVYEIVFAVGKYFRGQSLPLPEPPFLDEVPVRFSVADPQAHYHVPLLVSPWSYSTYRGS